MERSNLKINCNKDFVECAYATTTARISPRKLNLVAATIRGMDAQYAMSHLDFMKQRGAPIVRKVIHAAVANAAHNKGVEYPVVVLRAEVGCKGILRRGRPGSRSAAPISKRISYLKVVLGMNKTLEASKIKESN